MAVNALTSAILIFVPLLVLLFFCLADVATLLLILLKPKPVASDPAGPV